LQKLSTTTAVAREAEGEWRCSETAGARMWHAISSFSIEIISIRLCKSMRNYAISIGIEVYQEVPLR
jgi:hypothetical protein